MELELFVTEGLGDTSYLLASGDEAVLVDPQRDIGRFLSVAEHRGWRVVGVLETHVHNDYVSGALEVRAATGARIFVPARGGYSFDAQLLAEGDEIRVGDLTATVLETPGHTPEHVAYLVSAPDGAQRSPVAAFTGGSLIVGSAGRTDLLGPDRTDELTRAQYRTMSRLAELPPDVEVLPTHGAGSFCTSATGPGGDRTSRLGKELASNPALAARDEASFVADRLSGLLEYPTYYGRMGAINRAGPPLLRDVPGPVACSPEDVVARADAGAWIVDGRWRESFAKAHVPGSVNIELSDAYATYVGWIVPWDAPLVLVLPDPEPDALAEALTQLRRIGRDGPIGYLAGGMEAWRRSGGPVGTYGVARVSDLCEATRAAPAGSGPEILDVRQPSERAEGQIPGSRGIFVGDLRDRVDEVPAAEEVWAICRTGHRASIAASLLDRAGIPTRLVFDGGVDDWLETCR